MQAEDTLASAMCSIINLLITLSKLAMHTNLIPGLQEAETFLKS
jgi:hypothetical protein